MGKCVNAQPGTADMVIVLELHARPTADYLKSAGLEGAVDTNSAEYRDGVTAGHTLEVGVAALRGIGGLVRGSEAVSTTAESAGGRGNVAGSAGEPNRGRGQYSTSWLSHCDMS